MGLFERTPRFVKRFGDLAAEIGAAAAAYAGRCPVARLSHARNRPTTPNETWKALSRFARCAPPDRAQRERAQTAPARAIPRLGLCHPSVRSADARRAQAGASEFRGALRAVP